MNVPCIASDEPHPRLGQRGAQDRVPGDRAQGHRAAHEAEAEDHERRARGQERLRDAAHADVLTAW